MAKSSKRLSSPEPSLTACPACKKRELTTQFLRYSRDGINFVNQWIHRCKSRKCRAIIETEGEKWRLVSPSKSKEKRPLSKSKLEIDKDAPNPMARFQSVSSLDTLMNGEKAKAECEDRLLERALTVELSGAE